jgi:acetyl esterase/lipase
MKAIIHLLLIITLYTSCQQLQSNTSVALKSQTKEDVSYGKDTAQCMDIYLPAGRSAAATPSIILIHGGGWNTGDKDDFRPYIDTFRKRLPDYAIFNVNYRLVSEQHLFPVQERDIKAAMGHIVQHAAEYNISTDKFVLLGASAGAHLALLQAYKYATPDIKAVVSFFGPTDLTAMYNKPWHSLIPHLLKMLTGTTPQANATVYQQSSPAYFVNAKTAPTIILQGARDKIVDSSQSCLLEEKLTQAGVPNELVLYPKERHGWRGKNLTNSFDRIEAFLEKHVN